MKPHRLLPSALVLSLCLLSLCSCRKDAGAGRSTATVEFGSVERLVTDTGTVAYRDPYSIIPAVNGKILSCTFEEGDQVTAGQTLYVIDSTALEDQITQAQLSLKSALLAQGQAEAACEDLTVLSSVSGVLSTVHVHVGDYVAVGTPIAQVVDSANLTLTVPFSPADAAAMVPGSPAVLSFSSFSGTAPGQVKRIYEAPIALPGGREGVYVELVLPNPGALAAGESATASVGTADCMAPGTLAYATQQTIYSTQAGQVLTLPIEAGATVTAGQTVMTIDNPSLTNARDNAALAVETASVSLSQLEAKRSDYTLTAPVDGIVTSRRFQTGDYAAAATPMATLAGEAALQVQVPIDEIYIDQIWPGQQARVAFTADNGESRTFSASVRRSNDTGITSGGVTDYLVELDLDHTDGLKAGMNVTVDLITLRKERCLRLPSSAVSGGTVQVLCAGGKVEPVSVTIGISGGGYTEILSGLSEGDTVLLP